MTGSGPRAFRVYHSLQRPKLFLGGEFAASKLCFDVTFGLIAISLFVHSWRLVLLAIFCGTVGQGLIRKFSQKDPIGITLMFRAARHPFTREPE